MQPSDLNTSELISLRDKSRSKMMESSVLKDRTVLKQNITIINEELKLRGAEDREVTTVSNSSSNEGKYQSFTKPLAIPKIIDIDCEVSNIIQNLFIVKPEIKNTAFKSYKK